MASKTNKHWYNNGQVQICTEVCPEGFVKGMLPFTPEHRQKMSDSQKGRIPWNKGLKTNTPAWNRGIPMSESTKQKRLETIKKNHPNGIPAWNKGLKNCYSEDVTKRISNTLKTRYASGELISKTLGVKASPEKLKHLRDSHLGKRLPPDKKERSLQKRYNTCKINNTFNSSSCEKKYYNLLIDKFGKTDVVKEYREDRYPYKCDFYIKSKALFIELNIYPTHGKHAFNPNDKDDILELERLKNEKQTRITSKGSIAKSWAAVKIYVWTEYDPLKLKTLIDNKLNFKIYYREDEAIKDLSNL